MTVGLTSTPWLCSHLRSSSDFPGDSVVKDLPAKQETWVGALGQEDPLEKGMAIHSSILAWEMPRTGESDGFQSMGPQRIWCNWVTNTFTLNEQPQGKGRHWITSTTTSVYSLSQTWAVRSPSLGPKAWDEEEEQRTPVSCVVCPQVRMSVSFLKNDIWSSCGSWVPSIH